MMKRNGIYLLDDNALVVDSLKMLINRESDMRVVGSATNGHAAIGAITALHPDVAVIDLGLGDMDGLDVIAVLRRRAPRVRMLALSMGDEAYFALRSLNAGAQGYLMKHHAVDNILPAIRSIANGEAFLSNDIRRMFSRTGESAS